jgi:hypothetical protein
MTERIKAFASARIPGVGGGAEQPAKVQDGSIRGQMAELLPVFDALRASGKKIALIVDNAALLAGEPWAAFLLGILRQGELIEHVLQFVLIGHTSDMSQMMQTWPRVLEARVSRFALSRPSPDDLGTWLCNRLVLAGADRLIAEQVFTSAARKRLLDLTSCSLPKLSWLAEGAMVEAFMTGSHVVDVVHVDRSHSGGSELVTSDGVRGQMVVGAGASVRRQESHIDAQWGREQTNQEPGKTGEPSLLDLIKPE